MKYMLLDLLACPECRGFPLKLHVFSSSEVERQPDRELPLCELYCSYLGKEIKGNDFPCKECYRREVQDGLLVCPSCGRWFPIIDEIPRMLPDSLRLKREKKNELNFLKEHADKVPKEVLESGKPYNLKQEKA